MRRRGRDVPRVELAPGRAHAASTEGTTTAWFLLEAMAPAGEAELDAAADELLAHLAALGAGGRVDGPRQLP